MRVRFLTAGFVGSGEVTFEADPKHVEKMLQDMGQAECNPGLVPGAKDGTVVEGEQLTVHETLDL